jgi:hypothetical protein
MNNTEIKNKKPLGIKNYGSIGHLPNSRMGPADHHVHEGQSVICTTSKRDKNDVVIVSEKLDGSNVGVAILDGQVLALGRAGYLANTSKFIQHQMFASWVAQNEKRFLNLLSEGQRCVGEWLAQAHGTRYDLWHEPFVIFDIMEGHKRLPWSTMRSRVINRGFIAPLEINYGPSCSVELAMERIGKHGFHGAVDPVEGAVWRVERNGEFDFMAKFVRPDKVDGLYLTEKTGQPDVWNWSQP